MKVVEERVRLAATDLGEHVSCAHKTTLGLAVARRETPRPPEDPLLEVLRERGHVHEAAFADHLRASGRRVESGHDAGSLRALLREGVDVITQACLDHGAWSGRADFLIRVERPSALGPYSYEPYDTKLASETKLGAVLQLCVYADLLVHHQGIAPAYMHVVHPGDGFPTDSLRFSEYGAAYRALKKDLEAHVEEKRAPYPEPVAGCGTCAWWRRCADRRRADDHLSLVAGVPRNHRREFESRGITTLTQLACESRPFNWRPERGGIAPYELHGLQAELQVRARTETPPPFVRLPIEDGRGFVRLPAPSAGDIFLDLEGDPFIGHRGREYLFGWVVQDAAGAWVYERRWALDDEAESAAFVEFVDFSLARIGVHPDLHIYHFAPYEPSAFRRLKTAYSIRETEVTALLRERRFVDLMAITRQSLRIGVESYGLKPIEAVTGYRRDLKLDLAGPSIRAVRIALQRGVEELRDEWRRDVERYNRDDCVSTLALRDYLETVRTSAVNDGCEVPRPSPIDAEPVEFTEARARIEVLRHGLLAGLPDPVNWDGLQRGRAVLADLLGWYGREARVASADRHRLAALTELERVDDPHAIGGLSFIERQPMAGRQRLPIDRYAFPVQDLWVEEGDALWCSATQKVGQLVDVDFVAGTLSVRKTQESVDLHPSSCFVWQTVAADEKEAALVRVAENIVASGFAPAHEQSLVRDLLAAAVPRALVVGDFLRNANEEQVACARRLAEGLDGTVLGIQGPPGSGKTTAAAEMIFDLLRAGRRVGVCATSHKVIHHLITRVTALTKTHRPRFRTMVKTDAATVLVEGAETTPDPKKIEALLPVLDLVAGTAWLWARPKMVGSVDTLFVDEAGQMSLADAVAISGAARNLVLVGDPQQLEQPSQAAHPDLVPASALEHLIGGRATIDPRHGLLLDETFRLHPAICAFTSEQFYEERLHSSVAAAEQRLRAGPLESPGLYVALVNHAGNQNHSDEEAELVAEMVTSILDGGSWRSPDAQDLPLTQQDVLVVAPYNAHVATLGRALVSRGLGAVRVGTVDRFQGQEAPIAIYSMATSTQDDAPHGLAFLLSRHRLNVATSRARCAAIVVASSALSRPVSKTPNDLRLASAFCRFLELARALELPSQGNPPTTRTS